jgi:hypothetical protein
MPKGELVSGPTAASKITGFLRESNSASSSAAALAELKNTLRRISKPEAAEWIAEQLKEGEDITTGLGFVIGSDQNLSEWPTFRVFLLDVLFDIDPAEGARMGRKVLQTATNPDEWALAMRNVGAGSPSVEDVALLKAKSAEMLHNDAWRKRASAGYLEAFDVIVHTRNAALLPELIAYAGDTANKSVRHASFLTLDRLTLADPVAMFEKLIPSATVQPETALMVSNMVARADVRDPAQRRLVEDYLLDEKRTAPELQSFAGVFPNASQFVSHNLLTRVVTVDGGALAASDRATLDAVSAWLADSRFSRVHPLLLGTKERLSHFVTR